MNASGSRNGLNRFEDSSGKLQGESAMREFSFKKRNKKALFKKPVIKLLKSYNTIRRKEGL